MPNSTTARFDRSLHLFCVLASILIRSTLSDSSILQDGFGGYTFSTDVSRLLNLSYDVRDMRVSDLGPKYSIYATGKNALPLTLQQLSLNSSQYDDFPMYNMYRHAYYELGIYQEGDAPFSFDGHPIEQYANTLIEDLFLLNRTRIEADGALILNVAMAYWGSLYQMLQTCEAKGSGETMKGYLDQAAALWIGEGQVRSDNVKGYMLYNLAEIAGTNFMQDDNIGESKVNSDVLAAFSSIVHEIQADSCQSEAGYLQIRSLFMDLIKYTNIVLVQMLLHHVVVTQDSDFIELYALAITPQIAACDTFADEALLTLTVKQDVTDDTKASVISTVQGLYSCLRVSCSDIGAYLSNRIPQCTTVINEPLAGYQPVMDIREKAYIDRDIRQIYQFMNLQAYSAVKDVYNYGWNTNFSLRDLATNQFSPTTSKEYERIQMYFSDQNVAETMIMNVLDLQPPFDTATVQDRAGNILGIIEGVVMYYAVLAELESAIGECQNNSTLTDALSHWDGGAAFYIGSMEGAMETNEDRGQLLYGLAKYLCPYFKTCEANDSAINQAILNYLKFGRNSLSDGACASAASILQTNIKPFLLIPLVQATLYYTVKAAQPNPDAGSAGSLYAYADAILPALNEVNSLSASTIASNAKSGSGPNTDEVIGAFRDALASMTIDCSRIGQLTINNVVTNLCPKSTNPNLQVSSRPSLNPSSSPSFAVGTKSTTNLTWGRYIFVAEGDAENDSKFSLDIKAMRNAADSQAAEKVYSEKSVNAPNGLTGMDIYSLADMSTHALAYLENDPMYNFYRAAFYDDNDFDQSTTTPQTYPFADTVVRLALSPSKGNSQELAADAALAINIFFIITHRLYEAVRQCVLMQDASPLIDLAVGLWIGQEQEQGSFETGWSFYALAQTTAKLFGNDKGEAIVNRELMQFFNDVQSTASGCKNNSESFRILQPQVDATIKSFSKILVQQMLFQISIDNRNYVELYSLAFVPQAISCDQGTFEHLRDQLFLNFDRTEAVDDGIVTRLGKILRCLRFTCDDLGNTTNANEELKMLVDALCTEINTSASNEMLAGYQTDYNVYELSRIDLDILQLQLFMRTRSYELAAALYTNGQNSLDESGLPVSLQSLAIDNRTSADEIYDHFNAYFLSDSYADSLVLAAILPSGSDNRFESASRLQRAEAAFRTVQTMVPYMQIVAKLKSAVDDCKSSEHAQRLIDEAAALFVGSIEGPQIGGDIDQSGKLLFSLGKEFCREFGECESNKDSITNVFVLNSLEDMKRSITKNDCSSAGQIMNDVFNVLPIPLIQGTLSLAVSNAQLPARSEEESIATGFVLADAVLPLVKAANQTSAATILNNMDFNLNQKPVIDGAAAIFDAFKGSLGSMNVSCDYVGDLGELGLTVCDNISVAPNPDTPTSLGEDLYMSTTYVQDKADIALDVKAMEDALQVGRGALATIIYEEGDNSPIFDSSGTKVDLRSLQQFSVNAKESMKNNPLYLITVYALRNSTGYFMGQSAWQYADTLVQQLLESGAAAKSPVAAEAAVVLNLWMEVANQLFETLYDCKNGNVVGEDGIHSIDEAVAYWIGDGQIAGSAVRGHLLYALAEQMGDYFNSNNGTQSGVNANILRLFQQAKLELSQPQSCSADDTVAYSRLRHIINRIVTQMMIVNVQGLIHNLLVNDRQRVQLYAIAVVPLIVACSPTTFDYLSDKTINLTYAEADVPSILQAIRSSFPCFGITCDDVGIDNSKNISPCVDFDSKSALAGYRPASDVANFARIDLDLFEMDILLQMEAYGPAEDLYNYGKHATTGVPSDNTALSFQFLATMPSRSNVPQFASFVSFYGNDDRYADTMVRYAFMSNDNLQSDIKRSVILGTSQYMILFMAALSSMQESVSACLQGLDTAMQYWDQAAAWLIGSLEGQSSAGSIEGRSFWNLSKVYCDEFNTCSRQVGNSSQVNDNMLLKLYTGRGAVLAKSCGELQQTTTELSRLMYVPLIQGALSTTVLLGASSSQNLKEMIGRGYVYSHSLLPLIKSANTASADVIQKAFDLNGNGVSGGVEGVVSAYRDVFSALGVSCAEVGSSESIDTCTGVVQKNSSVVKITISALLCALALILTCYLLRDRLFGKCRSKEQPLLVASKGELNHTSDVIRKNSEDMSLVERVQMDYPHPIFHVDDYSGHSRSLSANEEHSHLTELNANDDENNDLESVHQDALHVV